MRKVKLLRTVVGLMLWAVPVGAQTQNVVMEVTDLYGDKEQVELAEGMTVYLPQGDPLVASFVLCDKEGMPVWHYPMMRLANIRYQGAAAQYVQLPYDLSAYREPTEDELKRSPYVLRWNVEGREYKFPHLGEWSFPYAAKLQHLITADGQEFDIPAEATQIIELCDTVVGVGGYLGKFDDCRIFQYAFKDGFDSQTSLSYECFFGLLPEDNGHNFSLLVPSDSAMQKYYDVVSFQSRRPHVISFGYKDGARMPITYTIYAYNPEAGEMQGKLVTETMENAEIINRLVMMLRSHTILHEMGDGGLRSGNEYFQTLDGSVVRVIKDEQGNPVSVQGTYQTASEALGIAPCRIEKGRQKGNGCIYTLDGVMQTNLRSAYSVLSSDEAFSEFYKLCQIDELMLVNNGLVNATNANERVKQLLKYRIFTDMRDANNGMGGMDQNLNFVGNCPFTIYVPTNEAIQAERAKGTLPTWEEIAEDYNSCEKTHEDSVRLQTKCLKVLNFIKGHIQFGMDIADQLPFSHERRTTVVTERLTTPRLRAEGQGKGRMTVTDAVGHTRNVVDSRKNIFVCDIQCSRNGKAISPVGQSTMRGITIDNYVTGVIHQIDGVLNYE